VPGYFQEALQRTRGDTLKNLQNIATRYQHFGYKITTTTVPTDYEECNGSATLGNACSPSDSDLELLPDGCSNADIPWSCNPEGDCYPQLLSGLTSDDLTQQNLASTIERISGRNPEAHVECFSPLFEPYLSDNLCTLAGTAPDRLRQAVDHFRLPVGTRCNIRDDSGNSVAQGTCDEQSRCVPPPAPPESCDSSTPDCTPCRWNGVERRFCYGGQCRTAQQAAMIYCPSQIRSVTSNPDNQCQACSAFFRDAPLPGNSCVSGYITGTRSIPLLYSMDGATCTGSGGIQGTCAQNRCVFPPPPPPPAASPVRSPSPSPRR
jgi:hypothetical protein